MGFPNSRVLKLLESKALPLATCKFDKISILKLQVKLAPHISTKSFRAKTTTLSLHFN